MNHTLIALGRLKKGPLHDLFSDYQKRLSPHLAVKELEYKKASANLKASEAELILKAIPHNHYVVALDERGDQLSSPELADLLRHVSDDQHQDVTWIIGGADGLDDSVRNRAQKLISFGRNTWPHMLVRVMLIEQLYRAQQILKGHPYHRD